MGRQARTTSEASFDTKLVVEKVALHQYVPHSPPLICSYADYGTLLRSLVSLPLQSFWKAVGIADGQRSWQEVQLLSPLQASVRFLPSMILAAILNLVTGLIVEKFPVIWLVLISSALGALAPLLMALNSPRWPYWYAAFPAQLFEPLSPDGAFSYGTTREKHRSLMATCPSDIHSRYPSSLRNVPRPDTSACRCGFQYRWSVRPSYWTCSHWCRVGFGDAQFEVCRQRLT